MSNSLALSLLAVAVLITTSAADDTPPFKITTKRDNDRVEVKIENDTTVISLHSPFGISNASIEHTDEKWPDAVVLRLHLKGLESFKATSGKVMLEGAVSIHDGKRQVRIWMNGKEDTPLDTKSSYWIDVRTIGDDGKPAKELPLKDGYFELPLPKSIIEENPKTITVSWIDFYRH